MKSTKNFIIILFLLTNIILLTSCQSKENKIELRFIVASDGHYGQENVDYDMDYKNIIKWLNTEYNTKGLDYAFFIGDLVHDNPKFLDSVKVYFDQLKSPYYVVKGNHEKSNAGIWIKTWGYTDNHDFEKKDYAFILASTSDTSGAYLCVDAVWLNQRLDYYSGKKYVFIFMHISQKDWTTHGIDCLEVREVIEKHPNVKAVFHGHDHQEDSIKTFNDKYYFWDGHFGGSWGVDYKGYRIVEVNKKGGVYTYQYNPTNDSIVNSIYLDVQ